MLTGAQLEAVYRTWQDLIMPLIIGASSILYLSIKEWATKCISIVLGGYLITQVALLVAFIADSTKNRLVIVSNLVIQKWGRVNSMNCKIIQE